MSKTDDASKTDDVGKDNRAARDPAPGGGLESWSLRQKLGQMVMCGFDGTQPSEGILRLIRDYRVGGIIYFRRNIGSAAEVAGLSRRLREANHAAGGAPLWIAVDQEGGMVARIDRDVSPVPGNMALGAAGGADLAYEAARISGVELRQLGISLNFAPCVDVNNNPANPVVGVRSFGEDPELVAVLGAAAIRGYQETGVSACAKHFPGHGDTAADSHHELPLVPHSRERLEQVELPPFRQAILAGVDAIMTAHVQFPACDPSGVPATLSPSILGGLLRRELGYEGVIVTDCLEMNAISQTVGVGRGAVLAVAAGADMVLVSHREDRQIEALEALYSAAESGELPMARIDEAVARILRAKARREEVWRRLVETGDVRPAGDPAHGRWVEETARRCVTLVKAEAGTLPLRQEAPTLVIWPEVRRSSEVDEIMPQELTLGKALAAYVADVRELVIGTEPTAAEREAVLVAARAGRLQIVAGVYNAAFFPGQARLVRELAGLPGARVTAVALRNPYDLRVLPQVHAYAACYESRPPMLLAAAGVLAGKLAPQGRLPVTLSAEYPAGWGLGGVAGEF
ncbi:beta-N-acetylhexosaminidase [Paenibacillus sp. YN15]|uniref:beta-N-acetylhexosaminidase n=1 Tax=Paenibacillus sp. YN15 TaxID=1742774 RepID=UPI000DCC1ED6|nr:beta-N-acetylhexosaminidase [Paenibacillus sp. YN15]RAV06604.1 beta-N-acetylhexosaminidase [Paenibacillus sp. YN15]